MGEHYTAPKLTGFQCDATDCEVSKVAPEPCDYRGGEERKFRLEASAEGWTIWAGRGRRVYCPTHGPKPGHKMWQVPDGR